MLKSVLFRPSNAKRITFFVIIDIIVSYFTLILSYDLRFSFQVPLEFKANVVLVFFVLIALKILALAVFKLYLVPWRFFGLLEALKLFYAHILAYGIFCGIAFLGVFGSFPLSVVGIDFVISSILIGAIRIAKRIYLENSPKNSPKPALIFGANTQAPTLIKAALNSEIPFYPLAIIAEDNEAVGSYISNLKVYPKSALKELIAKHKIKSAILTRAYAKPPLKDLFDALRELGIEEIKIATMLKDNAQEDLQDISIEDLLSRPSKDLDKETIGAFLRDKCVLITGAGGSIGSEIVRQCAEFGAKRLVLVEHSEFNLYAILEELNQKYPQKKMDNSALFRPCLLSILEKERLLALIQEEKPDIIVHAAAYKHVPLCEYNQKSAIENNIIGSKNVVDCAIEAGVPKIVMISTDKAVRPTNVMGATKRVVELYAQNVESKNSEIVAVRFGNVLGSSGSVVPKFKAQIQSGGPITVTHPDITRYFMLIPEACQLVLQAGAIAKGGEIFILDMGEPVKIVDLAKNMLRLYDKEHEIVIEFSGLRPGEKLYEELLIGESEGKTKYPSIQVACPTHYAINKLNEDIAELIECKDSKSRLEKLKEIVVEFNHNAG
ncbi:UDP-N-acetylglucosamine 4,6-dehydratase (configuration-retaining) [Helicobacter sp. MIT 11-5569]|uniref:UDP-N-acetylglucosamine 4,6-dehydratase (configuration-retaining) n=1 Tax=Helicobacter sp. MIT 11-5569 TaxID=1548151 RepID=UPI00051FD141|nr:UDP-N-acetylglucosamine 4,6-dehydratase (configuration-retaining) [Helicobacter sp. MIT 11-5569]TLD79882.1 UDP-N-acetylglucosamine 4,6-dehydratase (configuration-retaining) [Helicobacter sp. MIT 11-5569]